MKIFSKLAGAGFLAGVILGAPSAVRAADASAPQWLQFKFELNHPLVYSAGTTTRTTTSRTVQLDTGNKSAVTTNLMETRYKMRLTPVQKLADGSWLLHYEPFDFEEDLDTTAAGGHGVTSIHGLEVKSTENGITVADTSKGLGMAQAKAFKQGIYSRLLSGYFYFQPIGVVSKVDGDLPFIDYWGESIKYQVGLFDIVFPTNPVPAGGSWTKSLAIKDWEGIKLGDAGLDETNTFVRQDSASATNQLIPITVNMAVDQKNLIGNMETMGQNTMLNLSDFEHHKSGKFVFDAEPGRLKQGDEDETLKLTMDMLVQGHTMTVSTEMTIHSKFELLKE